MKTIGIGLLGVMAFMSLLPTAAFATAPGGLTVLVAPARYSVLQVAFDVVNRFGAVLVSYQGEPSAESPKLDYWNGAQWVPMSLDDYANATYLRESPQRIVVVGGGDILPPVLVESVSAVCGDVRQVSEIDTPGLVNALGAVFAFQSADWEWFARRFNLQLEDKNAERRQRSWYDRATYDDEWAHKWKWLRRKYNDPQAAPASEPAPAPEAAAPVEPVPEFRTVTVTPEATEVVVEETVVVEEPVAPAEPVAESAPAVEPEAAPAADVDVEAVVIEEQVEAYPVK